jgi:soluble cytochrome b562
VTLAVSAVLSIYLAISPVLYKIKKTSDTFDKASDKLDKSQELTEKAKKQLKSTQDDIMKLEGEFAEVKEGYKQMITSVSNIEKIVRLAFENNDELIVKGFANEIAKVGSEDEVIKENEKA